MTRTKQIQKAGEEKNKGGRPVGWRKKDSKAGIVRLRCHLKDKSSWVKAAQRKGQKLTPWIEAVLNKAAQQ